MRPLLTGSRKVGSLRYFAFSDFSKPRNISRCANQEFRILCSSGRVRSASSALLPAAASSTHCARRYSSPMECVRRRICMRGPPPSGSCELPRLFLPEGLTALRLQSADPTTNTAHPLRRRDRHLYPCGDSPNRHSRVRGSLAIASTQAGLNLEKKECRREKENAGRYNEASDEDLQGLGSSPPRKISSNYTYCAQMPGSRQSVLLTDALYGGINVN